MIAKRDSKLFKQLLRELPYNGINIVYAHGQFINSLPSQTPSKKYLERLTSFFDVDIFNLNDDNSLVDADLNCLFKSIRCKYYSPARFNQQFKPDESPLSKLSLFHTNIRSLRSNLDDFQRHILLELDFHFNIIAVTETRIYNDILDFNPNISDYNFEFVPTPLSAGGVGMYIDETMNYTVIERTSNEAFQALWIELQFVKQSNIICGVIYRQHHSVERFLDYFEEAVDGYSAAGKPICLLGDVNINILLAQTCNYAQQFLDCLQSYALLPTTDKPTRVCNNSATLIDNIFTNKFSEYFASGNIVSDITDHFSQFCIFQSSILTSQPAKITSRDYSKYSEQRFLQDLSQLHWESLLSGSDVDKLFSTFYNKLNKLINKYAPLRSLSKRKIKRLSKPWITKGIRKSIRIKNELFFSGDRDKYKFYRNKILHLSRISKRTFYHNYFAQNVCNMKGLGRYKCVD